jgi:leader peptidase (prepilin peptidase)/N-methyltransferase
MNYILPYLCLLFSLPVLGALAVIDLKTRLLPNRLVLTFALLGLAFQINTEFAFVSPQDMLLGLLAGGGLLYIVRLIANHHYKTDTLGLGDVKLMSAGGLWLGLDHILLATTLGALIGALHGLGHAYILRKQTQRPVDLKSFAVPAGPGFIMGLALIGIFKFQTLPELSPLLNVN